MQAELERETTELLARLIQIDTVNPPGGERPAQELLAGLLSEAGFDVTLLGRTEDRPNLLARLHGDADGPTLCLLAHLDTVPATPSEWQRDPWGGEIVDGVLWGRGSQDMKNQAAAEVTAALTLARSGWRPARGELLVVMVVDEESGGGDGAVWLTDNHPQLVRCDLLLNEGGGGVIDHDGGRLYPVCVAEKGVLRFTLRTEGVAGHASMPARGDNALLKLAPLLTAMAAGQPERDITAPPRALLDALGLPIDDDPDAAIAALRARDAALAALIEPMLGVTVTPTIAAAGATINVIPASATLHVDCRIPPGMDAAAALARVHGLLGGEGYELTVDEAVIGNSSPAEGPLMDALDDWVAREDPGARTVPFMLPAFTDSRTFRAAFPECTAYGFFPQRELGLVDATGLWHAKDERIATADLGFAARCYRDLTLALLG